MNSVWSTIIFFLKEETASYDRVDILSKTKGIATTLKKSFSYRTTVGGAMMDVEFSILLSRYINNHRAPFRWRREFVLIGTKAARKGYSILRSRRMQEWANNQLVLHIRTAPSSKLSSK